MTRKHLCKTPIALAIAATLPTFPALTRAQDATPPPAQADESGLETIVVTGVASAAGVKKLEASYNIVTANEEEIRRANPKSTADLLRMRDPAEDTVGLRGDGLVDRCLHGEVHGRSAAPVSGTAGTGLVPGSTRRTPRPVHPPGRTRQPRPEAQGAHRGPGWISGSRCISAYACSGPAEFEASRSPASSGNASDRMRRRRRTISRSRFTVTRRSEPSDVLGGTGERFEDPDRTSPGSNPQRPRGCRTPGTPIRTRDRRARTTSSQVGGPTGWRSRPRSLFTSSADTGQYRNQLWRPRGATLSVP